MVRMHDELLASFSSADESLMVRVYIGSISKGMLTQLVSLLWMSKTLLYESPYIVIGNIKVAGS
ncbi:hypothetical protein COL32_21550 [Bacillus pseudomycoides]|uniref:Uncharacterized protein n=1 Tax=Bacillus pseudomycoides TaxID=64104 RepID=A0ABD6T220_9BACI|nr:hypothetical protein CN564_06585 [Bacillus pseudomycoides]PFW86882.1 hypothetical protein COL29_30040 [Bacillus pseudomycoides]PFX40315.1 hypothetical protein COL32_21550 [Bacillus pseudomycoides]PGD74985.1 hypothetical protein COM46_17255 [Bacillus pseudomycoides]PGF05677.1 hypothetical protein COM59_28705 [Bacillus pseudomycoides]